MISVVIQSNNSATVTRTPGLLARMFLGRQEPTREVFNAGLEQWIYADDNTFVEPDVEDAVERAFTLRAVRARRDALVRR